MPLVVDTAPTVPIVTLAEMKRHLGVTSNDRDLDIESLTDAATNYVARRCKRTLPVTTYVLTMSDWDYPAGDFCKIFLPRPPVISVELVRYYDGVDLVTPVTIAPASYQLVRSEIMAYLLPAPGERWPVIESERADAFEVQYTAGYVAAPPEAKRAVMLLARHWYDNASAVTSGETSKEVELSLASLVRSLGIGFYADVSTDQEGSY